MENKGKNKVRKKSIRTRLLTIPVALVIISIIGIVISVGIRTDSSMKTQMREETEFLLTNVVERLADNSNSIETINNSIENEIRHIANSIKSLEGEIDNETLASISKDFETNQINYWNQEGVVAYSSLPEYIGFDPKNQEEHSMTKFINGDNTELMEDIRHDSVGDTFIKYGAIKNPDGTIIQIGLNADYINNLTKQFEYQTIIDDLMANEEVVYAGFLDNNYIYQANSGEDFIGTDMSDDQDVVKTITEGEPITGERVSSGETGEIQVLDTIYPVIIEGETLGALKIGFTLDYVNTAIKNSIISVVAIGLIVIAILSFTLYKTSNMIINILNSFKADSELMAEGDFSMDVPEEMMALETEFGEIARANMAMKVSIRNILSSITNSSEVVAAHSEELTATTQESERAADELSIVIQEIAEASTSQAGDVDFGFNAVQELDRVMNINNDNIEKLNISTEEVTVLKDEGLEHIRDLVSNTEITRRSVREIGDIIDNTNTSAENIVNAIHMIKSISDQTNLLALNASIEAARAGEAGRGFAVVAEEIRKLAEESSSFTQEIEVIVEDLTSKTLMAVETMDNVEETFNLQGESVELTDGKFQGISESLEKIYEAIEEVNNSSGSMDEQKENLSNLIENLAAVAEENAAGTEEAAASVEEQNAVMAQITHASGELATIAEELNEEVHLFKI